MSELLSNGSHAEVGDLSINASRVVDRLNTKGLLNQSDYLALEALVAFARSSTTEKSEADNESVKPRETDHIHSEMQMPKQGEF